MLAQYTEYANILKPYVIDTVSLLHQAIEEDKKILCEGAQATLLDIDFGSYPFVTSSNPTIGECAQVPALEQNTLARYMVC